MPTERSRQTALRLASLLGTRKLQELAALGTPTATWTLTGPADKLPGAGPMPFAERVNTLEAFFKNMKTLSFEVKSVVAEGDSAVLEAVARAEGSPEFEGRLYENKIIMKIIVGEDGRITEIREWVDWFSAFAFQGIEVKIGV